MLNDKNSFLLNILFLLCLMSIFYIGCSTRNKYDKSDHRLTYEIQASGIFVELYRTAGYGVYGGDVESVYLTDSISFRKFVGQVDDNQKFNFTLEDNKVRALKIEPSYLINDKKLPKKVLSERVYNVDELRSRGEFD